MGEKMTLEQVRNQISDCAEGRALTPMRAEMKQWADALTAHLTQPAQAVDVGAIREVTESLREYAKDAQMYFNSTGEHLELRIADKHAETLARALSVEKAGPVGDDKVLWGVVANAGRLSKRRQVRWAHVSDATGQGSNASAALCRRFGFDPDEEVPASPTPDKEG